MSNPHHSFTLGPPKSSASPSRATPAHPARALRYQHTQDHRGAELGYHELDQLWSVTILQSGARRVHGLYPSLASAQLILYALGFQRCEEAIA